MGLLLLSARKGAVIEISTQGNQEQELLEGLCNLIKNKFDEE